MKTSINAFLAAHKTQVMIACAVLVMGAKTISDRMNANKDAMPQTNSADSNGWQQAPAQQMQSNQQHAANMQRQGGTTAGYNNYGQQAAYYGNGYGNSGYNNNSGYGYYATPSYGYGNYSGYNTGSSYTGTSNTVDYTSGWEAQQKAQDSRNEQFDDYIRDQGNYQDADGNTYKMSDMYSNNWVNNTTGEGVQTNDPSYDPNASSTSSDWSSVTPSSYSSESTTTGDE